MPKRVYETPQMEAALSAYLKIVEETQKSYGVIPKVAKEHGIGEQSLRKLVKEHESSSVRANPRDADNSTLNLEQRVRELEEENLVLSGHVKSLIDSLRSISSAKSSLVLSETRSSKPTLD